VADDCIHNPENGVNNNELVPEDAYSCMMMMMTMMMVMITHQYELMFVN